MVSHISLVACADLIVCLVLLIILSRELFCLTISLSLCERLSLFLLGSRVSFLVEGFGVIRKLCDGLRCVRLGNSLSSCGFSFSLFVSCALLELSVVRLSVSSDRILFKNGIILLGYGGISRACLICLSLSLCRRCFCKSLIKSICLCLLSILVSRLVEGLGVIRELCYGLRCILGKSFCLSLCSCDLGYRLLVSLTLCEYLW